MLSQNNNSYENVIAHDSTAGNRKGRQGLRGRGGRARGHGWSVNKDSDTFYLRKKMY